MTTLTQPAMGPVWKSFVDHVQHSIVDYGHCLDVEIIGMDGIERLESEIPPRPWRHQL